MDSVRIPIWLDILESDTLNYEVARENDDERHIARCSLKPCAVACGYGRILAMSSCRHLWASAQRVISQWSKVGGSSALNSKKVFQPSGKNIRAAVKQESLFV